MNKLLLLLIPIVLSLTGCSNYDVYYWKNLKDQKSEDNVFIGTVDTLKECENLAMNYASHLNERWNYRAYICVKMVGGSAISKHRYGEPQ